MCLPGPPLPGTGAPAQVFIGHVPKEGCGSAVPCPANGRRPHSYFLLPRELGMTRPMVFLLEGHGEEGTGRPSC